MHWIWTVASLLTARMLIVRRRSLRDIFLTFDDGPHPELTPKLLALLGEHGIRATFFLQGAHAAAHAHIVGDIVRAGHVIANHSYSHPSFNRTPLRVQIEEMDRTDALLAEHDGQRRHMFRPPHGRLGLTTIAICGLRRQRIVLWNRDSFDYRLSTEEVIARIETMPIAAGDVLLFHDDSRAGLGALEQLIPRWKASGLEFAPL